jgi:hypothetical protein
MSLYLCVVVYIFKAQPLACSIARFAAEMKTHKRLRDSIFLTRLSGIDKSLPCVYTLHRYTLFVPPEGAIANKHLKQPISLRFGGRMTQHLYIPPLFESIRQFADYVLTVSDKYIPISVI